MRLFRAQHAKAYEEKLKALRNQNKGRPPAPFRGHIIAQIEEEGVHNYANRKLQEYQQRLRRLKRECEAQMAAPLLTEEEKQQIRQEVLEAWNLK